MRINVVSPHFTPIHIVRRHMRDDGDFLAAFQVFKINLAGVIIIPRIGVNIANQIATAGRAHAMGGGPIPDELCGVWIGSCSIMPFW